MKQPASGARDSRLARRRWIVGASALFIAAMLASAAHDLWTSRREAERQAAQEIGVLARVLAEQTRRSLQTVDVMLREIADAHRAGQLPAASSRELHEYLQRQRSELSDVSSVFVAGADGMRLATSAAFPAAPANFAERPTFRLLASDRSADSVVGRVARSADEQRWQLPIIRRLDTTDGRFDGVVGALLDASYFERFYADVRLGDGNVVALVNRDGTLVARHPLRSDAVGQPIASWAQGLEVDSGPQPRRFVSALDRVERLGVVQAVPGYALDVVVARDTDLVFASWREAAWGSAVRTALLCAAALGLVAVVLRQLQRLETARASLGESEQQLREQKARLDELIDSAPEAIILYDAEWRCLRINRELTRLFGWEPHEIVGRAGAPLIVQPGREDEGRRIRREVETGVAFSVETERQRRDGAPIDVSLVGAAIRVGGARIGAFGIFRDISERKRAESALRVSEERYALAVAGANEGLWDWDLATDRVFFSPRGQQACGVPPGEPLRDRREWLALLHYHPDDRQRVRDALVEHLQGRVAHYDVEMRLGRPDAARDPERDDDWNWVRQRGLLVRDDAGRPRRMAGSVEDITARKRAESLREQLEVRLRTAQKLEAMGTLAGGIAHDFNNILGAILGYAELARGHAARGSALQEQLDGVMSAGLRAKSLVQRILAFSRSGLGESVDVHVQSVVGEALDLLEASLPAGIALRRDLRAGDAALVGDPAQIHQVVMNLGTNAMQASRSPGVVSVTLAPRTLERPLLAASGELPAGEYLELVVRDEGSGIEPEQIERIFDPFFTTKGVGVGTGLGLSLVHGIVAELHGAIDVASEPGRGSTFSVLLPWNGRVTADPRRSGGDATLPRGDGQRVLLVDDEPALVALGEETLASLGYEPVGYTSSVAALRAFEQAPQRFDAVLSDEAMPQLTGTQLAAAVLRARPGLPVLLMSGYVAPALAARALELGVRDVLAKPLVARDIAQALAAALGGGATK